MHGTLEIIQWILGTALGAGALGWLGFRALKRSEDPARLVFKWILTAILLWILFRKVAPMIWTDAAGVFIGIPLVAVCGVVMAILWRRALASIVAKPVGDLFDGGDQEIDPAPMYSIAQAKRNRGHYDEAAREIRKQLDLFPGDPEGHFLLAEIQVQHLNDLPGAEITLQRLCHQPGQTPRTLAFALNTLADWHLKYDQDHEAARQDLEQIRALLPDSEWSALAAQRIAHLADTGFMLESHDRKPVALPTGVDNIGLLPADQQPVAPEATPESLTAGYVRHLQEHPLDTEAREKLAILYADHYHHLQLAADQLEQLISHPGQPAKRVVRWLNLLADLQIRHSGDYDTVRQTIQRIIDGYPGSAAAETARSRLNHLKLELKAKHASQSVALGSYDQDIGLHPPGR